MKTETIQKNSNSYTPFFSIITASLNCASAIEKTYNSISMQTFRNYEYIVIDGVSNDNSQMFYKEWARNDSHFRYISERDNGIYDAMNKGISLAKGAYVFFIGAGDLFVDNMVLQNVYEELTKVKADVIYGYIFRSYLEGRKEVYKQITNFKYTLEGYCISHQAVFAKRELLLERKFDLQYKICADQDWLMYEYKRGKRFRYIDRAICYYDFTGVSSVEPGLTIGPEEVKRIHIKYYPVRRYIWRLSMRIIYHIKRVIFR